MSVERPVGATHWMGIVQPKGAALGHGATVDGEGSAWRRLACRPAFRISRRKTARAISLPKLLAEVAGRRRFSPPSVFRVAQRALGEPLTVGILLR
jgi:hypothetical protein